jgi:hypothetical protein
MRWKERVAVQPETFPANSLPSGKIAAAAPAARSESLKSAGNLPWHGEKAGNCGKPNSEAIAFIRARRRRFTDIRSLIEKKSIANLYNICRHPASSISTGRHQSYGKAGKAAFKPNKARRRMRRSGPIADGWRGGSDKIRPEYLNQDDFTL